MKGMYDRDEIMGTVTDEELELIHKWERASNYRDDCAGKLNDLIDDALNQDPTEIGKAHQNFIRAEQHEKEAHAVLSHHFTIFQCNLINQLPTMAIKENKCETGSSVQNEWRPSESYLCRRD